MRTLELSTRGFLRTGAYRFGGTSWVLLAPGASDRMGVAAANEAAPSISVTASGADSRGDSGETYRLFAGFASGSEQSSSARPIHEGIQTDGRGQR